MSVSRRRIFATLGAGSAGALMGANLPGPMIAQAAATGSAPVLTPLDTGVEPGEKRDSRTRQTNRERFQQAIDRAYAEGGMLFVPAGTYEIEGGPLDLTGRPGFCLVGTGPQSSIVQYTNNEHILDAGTANPNGTSFYHIEGLRLAYARPQTAQENNAFALHLQNIWMSSFRRLDIRNSFNGIRSSAELTDYVFSCLFEHIRIITYANCGIRMYSGTGNVFNNIYISNGNKARQGVAHAGIFHQNMGQGVYNQLNIEWSVLAQCIELSTARNLTINGLNIEGCSLGRDDTGFIRIDYGSRANFRGVSIGDCRIVDQLPDGAGGCRRGSVVVMRQGCDLLMEDVRITRIRKINAVFNLVQSYDGERSGNRAIFHNVQLTREEGSEHNLDRIDAIPIGRDADYRHSAVLAFNLTKGGLSDLVTFGDENVVYHTERHGPLIRFNRPLSAPRTVTLSDRIDAPYGRDVPSPVLPRGAQVRVVRSAEALGAEPLTVLGHDGRPLHLLRTAQAAEFMFDGAAWVLVGRMNLA